MNMSLQPGRITGICITAARKYPEERAEKTEEVIAVRHGTSGVSSALSPRLPFTKTTCDIPLLQTYIKCEPFLNISPVT